MSHLAFVWANLRRRPFQNSLGLACTTLLFTLHGLAFGMLESFRRSSIQNEAFEQQFERGAIAGSATGLALFLVITSGAIAHAVRQRRYEFGLLKALGFSHRRVVALMVAEAAAPSLTGSLLGLFAAPVLFDVLATRLPPLAAWPPPVYTPMLLSSTVAFALLVPLLASLVPALRIVRLDAAVALSGSADVQGPMRSAGEVVYRAHAARRPTPKVGNQLQPVALAGLNLPRQLAVMTRMGFSTLHHRMKGALLITGSVGFAVFVLMFFLCMAQGIRTAILGSGDPARVVLRAASNTWLQNGRLPDGIAAIAASAPGVARAADGAPLAEAAIYRTPRQFTRRSNGRNPPMVVGAGPHWVEMTPSFRLLSGRLPRPGTAEVLVGRLMDELVGKQLKESGIAKYQGMEWQVVGTFATDDWWDGYVVADHAVVKARSLVAMDSAVLVKLDSPRAFDAFHAAMVRQLPPSIAIEREPDFYAAYWASLPKTVLYVAFLFGGLLGMGAIAAVTHSVAVAMEERRREIATLRVLGFDGRAVAAAVVLEAMLLAALGASIGTAMMWWWRDGQFSMGGWSVWQFVVDLQLFLLAAGWSAFVAMVGALPLVLRTLRQREIEMLSDLREMHAAGVTPTHEGRCRSGLVAAAAAHGRVHVTAAT